MSLKKKVVWLPYDMDTAIGINNEGELVFDYQLEDIDHQQGGANIFNGQDSVIWKNIRACFPDELRTMYRNLRSSGALSYQKVEQMFEEHQGAWSEAIFNEDARFKYIDPFVYNNQDYLGMLLGSKAEQRKWWLYNRFRYIDSKYIAGDAMTDTITLRPYAADDISITPYADIYATIAWDAKITQERCPRNTTITLECPYESMNDNVVTIYSASQLASIGDVSGLQVGVINISNATRIQNIKVGDPSSSYDNTNLRSLTLGNNVLLQTLDVRNCSGLGNTSLEGHTQQTVDISGCSIIENVYFSGTNITGLTFPNGGVVKNISLPNTITNLTILNQPSIQTFSMDGDDYSNISTLRIENCSSVIPVLDILSEMQANSRVRIIGFTLAVSSTQDVEDFYDYLDTMRGLDENGNNLEKAVVSGRITGIDSVTGEWIAEMQERYPDIVIEYNHITSNLYYYSYDGTTLLHTEVIADGGNGTYSGTPSRPSTAQYNYTFVGWSKSMNSSTADSDAQTSVLADRTIYAAYTATVRTYTIQWKNYDGSTIETDSNVPYGSTPHYDGSTPTYDGQTSTGWTPEPTTVTGDAVYTATYLPVYSVYFYNGSTLLQTVRVQQGGTAVYTGSTPVSPDGTAEEGYEFTGWSPSPTNVQANLSTYAQYTSPVQDVEITDSWDTIIANIDNGTYKTRYKLGNYKPLDLGTEGTINMQIVAFDADELVSGGKAPITFIGKELLTTKQQGSQVANYINNVISGLIPNTIKQRIQTVNKTTRTAGGQITGTRTLWYPSLKEMSGSTYSYAEIGSVDYTEIFKNKSSRIKQLNGENTVYWLRTLYDANPTFFAVLKDGGIDAYSSNYTNGICLGFCLGLESETITDTWSEIFANEANGTYSTKYSIGDTKSLDLGSEGVQLMEIVAFDTDNKADGSGKAKITWISKGLLPTAHVMNSTATTAGGWESSEMRTYLKNTIKPLIPETVRNAILPVTKVQSTVTNNSLVTDGQTSIEDVWIPSTHEMVSASTETETTDVTYTKFSSLEVRKKKQNGNLKNYWARSAYTAFAWRYIKTNGGGETGNANKLYYIALGFCT